jgi:hypothetical protein
MNANQLASSFRSASSQLTVNRARQRLDVVSSELALRRMRSETNRRIDLSTVAADVTHYSCRIPVNNAGEARPIINFPCRFGQLPTVTFGFELHSSDHQGKMPVFAASVDEWITIDRLPGSRLYAGARFLISSEAADDIAFVVTATISGVAYGGPVDRILPS